MLLRSTIRRAGPPRRPAPLLAALLTAGTVFIAGCASELDNRTFYLDAAPFYTERNDPLEPEPVVVPFNPGSQCTNPIEMLVNKEDFVTSANSAEVRGSFFVNTGDFGPQRIANGLYTLVDDDGDGAYESISGDGLMALPRVGFFSDAFSEITDFARTVMQARTGHELQGLGLPIPADNRCYFKFELLGGNQPAASGGLFSFQAVSGTVMVMDPTDPLIYFKADTNGVPGKSYKVGSKTKAGGGGAPGIERVAMGVSAGGRLTARDPNALLPGNPSFGAHVTVGADIALPKVPVTVSGDLFVRFGIADAGDGPEVDALQTMMLGSAWLNNSAAATDIGDRVGVDLGEEQFHLGDGAVYFSGNDNEIAVRFGLVTADVLGKTAEIMNALNLAGNVQAQSLFAISGLFYFELPGGPENDAAYAHFELDLDYEAYVNGIGDYALGVPDWYVQFHILIDTDPSFVIAMDMAGGLTIGPFAFFASGSLQNDPFFFAFTAMTSVQKVVGTGIASAGLKADGELTVNSNPYVRVAGDTYYCLALQCPGRGDDPTPIWNGLVGFSLEIDTSHVEVCGNLPGDITICIDSADVFVAQQGHLLLAYAQSGSVVTPQGSTTVEVLTQPTATEPGLAEVTTYRPSDPEHPGMPSTVRATLVLPAGRGPAALPVLN